MQSRILRLLAALLAFTLIAAACGDDDDPIDDSSADDTDEDAAAPATVLDLAVEAGQFTTLAAAIDAAGLTETLEGDGPFTVLAPTDAAFEEALTALGITAEQLLANENLAEILTYHVLPQEADSQLVATLDGQSVATVNGAEVDVTVDSGTIFVNQAEVVSADLAADNGIVHVINAVLLPADIAAALGAGGDEMTDDEMTDDEATDDEATDDEATDDESNTIVDIAAGNEDFSILVAALTEAELVETLSGDGPFTVFAPTDDAFEAALADLGLTADELLASEDLAAILTYHVIAGAAVFSTDLTDGQVATTANGADITIGVSDDGVTVNEANVVAADVEADNGVIHVIDSVLLPPA